MRKYVICIKTAVNSVRSKISLDKIHEATQLSHLLDIEYLLKLEESVAISINCHEK